MDFEVSVKELFFKFKAHDYMEVVSYLVSLNPDEPRPYPVYMPDEVIKINILERAGNGLLQHGKIMVPEKSAPADYIFPET